MAESKGKSKFWTRLFGFALFIFALLHALPGMLATTPLEHPGLIWTGTAAWFLAAACLVAAAYGLWGFPFFGKRWRSLAIIGSIASIALIAAFRQWSFWPMMVVAAAALSIAVDGSPITGGGKERKFLGKVGIGFVQGLAILALMYGSGVILTRPLHQQWGATREEILRVLPGDAAVGSRKFLINHVVTVDAPPEKIWPWLIQLGQDKAGFYSYDWLERAVGDDVKNTFELRPEWQRLQVGDLVRATQPSWMGGIFGKDLGWKVIRLDPNRLMSLELWGDFWLQPTMDGKTRLGVRSHVGEVPFWAAPIEVFGFEPAHFIMEQKMLRTIKELAEKG